MKQGLSADGADGADGATWAGEIDRARAADDGPGIYIHERECVRLGPCRV